MDNHGVARTNVSRTEEQRQQDLEKIAKYRALDDEFRSHAAAKNYSAETLALSAKLLRLNPEHYTVWNTRRRCLQVLTLDPLSSPGSESTGEPSGHVAQTLRSELVFTIPLLQGFPKCYWIWNHRLWALQQCIALLPRTTARTIWEEELALAGKMLTRDRRNFHAWGYRRQLVARLESEDLFVEGKKQSMVEDEFEYTTRMTRVDLSNFSAWHRRGELITRLLDERGAGPEERKKMLSDELEFIRGGLDVGPEDQSIWYYHHFLMRHVVPDKTLPASASIAPDLAPAERTELATREIDAIRELLEDFEDVKWVYEALVEYVMARNAQGEEQAKQQSDADDLGVWVGKLRELDPMRKGRWDDLEAAIAAA